MATNKSVAFFFGLVLGVILCVILFGAYITSFTPPTESMANRVRALEYENASLVKEYNALYEINEQNFALAEACRVSNQ